MLSGLALPGLALHRCMARGLDRARWLAGAAARGGGR
jgi:hypothetical protein